MAWRDIDGEFHVAYDHSQLGDDREDRRLQFFDWLAERMDRTGGGRGRVPPQAPDVQYLEQEGMDDFTELFGFLSDLQTNGAATVEWAKREEV